MVRAAYASAWLPLPASMGRMAIVTTGRAGSELLSDLLDRHPRVHSEGEILRQGPEFPRAFLRGRVHTARRAGASAYVFKLAALQLAFPRMILQPRLLFADLAADGFTFLYLTRRDALRQAVSYLRSKDNGAFHPRGESALPTGPQVIDPVELIASLRWIEEHDEVIAGALDGLPVRRICYEDDLEDPVARRATLESLFADLGVEPVFEASDLQKATPRDLSDAVANLDEVYDALRPTRFASLVPAPTR
jgi:hypothetical protein